MWWHGACHCPRCRKQKSLRIQEIKERKRAGEVFIVPVQPALNHIKRLRSRGYTLKSIAEAAGIPRGTIGHLGGSSGMARASHVEAILGLTMSDPVTAPALTGDFDSGPRAACLIPASRVVPLIEEMHKAGYSRAAIARMAGINRADIYKIGRQWSRVTWARWVRLSTLYVLLARRGEVSGDLLHEVA